MRGGMDDSILIPGPSMYLDDNGAYPRRLRTSLSKIMDKPLEYNNVANVIPLGHRSRSRSNSIGHVDSSQTPISNMLRSASPIRIPSISTCSSTVQPPKMYREEYLMKNNNSNQVLKQVSLGSRNSGSNTSRNKNTLLVNATMPARSQKSPIFGHSRKPSTSSQISGTTKYVELEPPKFKSRFPSADSYTSSSPTVTSDLELLLLAEEELQNRLGNDCADGVNSGLHNGTDKRHSILSNFMNDEQMWLNDKDSLHFNDDVSLEKDRIDLTIKKLELKIDELKLDNEKLHSDNEQLKQSNNKLLKANEDLDFQNRSLLKHIQSLPRISDTDFKVRVSERGSESISERLPFKSDALVKVAVEGKIKQLEKELAKYKRIKKAAEANLSSRKSRLKYLTVEQLDALIESKSDDETSNGNLASLSSEEGQDSTSESSTETKELAEATQQEYLATSRLEHGFNLRLKLATHVPDTGSIPQEKTIPSA